MTLQQMCAPAEVSLASGRTSCATSLSGVGCQVPSQVLEEVPEGPCPRGPEQVLGAHPTVLAPDTERDGAAGHPHCTAHPPNSGPLWKADLALTAALGAAAASLGEKSFPSTNTRGSRAAVPNLPDAGTL